MLNSYIGKSYNGNLLMVHIQKLDLLTIYNLLQRKL
jgi:hypothetical protein